MAFDSRDYRDGRFIWPQAYAPWAPLTGEVLSNVLQNAYLSGRYDARLIWFQHWAYSDNGITAGRTFALWSSIRAAATSVVDVTSNVATVTTPAPHLFVAGQAITIAGISVPLVTPSPILSIIDANNFTVALTTADVHPMADGVGVATRVDAYEEVAEGYGYVPAGATHIVCQVTYSVLSQRPVQTDLRLTVDDGSHKQQVAVHQDSSIGGAQDLIPSSWAIAYPNNPQLGQVSGNANRYAATIELPITAPMTAPGTWNFRLEGHTGDSAGPGALKVTSVVCAWEVRG